MQQAPSKEPPGQKLARLDGHRSQLRLTVQDITKAIDVRNAGLLKDGGNVASSLPTVRGRGRKGMSTEGVGQNGNVHRGGGIGMSMVRGRAMSIEGAGQECPLIFMNSMHNEWHKTERTDLHVHKFYHLIQTSSLCRRAVVAWLAHLLLIDPDTSLVQGKPPRVWVTTYRKQYLHTSGFNTINCTPSY